LKNKAVIITGTAKAIKSLKLKVDKISISEIL
jgi:malonyl CoA-acyl carrier protein transacylase